MDIVVESVTNLRWVDAANTIIDMDVKFEHLDSVVPFTASMSDIMQHGQQLFANAVNGDYGIIEAYVAPTPAEIALRDNPPLRNLLMAKAMEKYTHYDLVNDIPLRNDWKNFYQALYALASNPAWPIVAVWPTEPVV